MAQQRMTEGRPGQRHEVKSGEAPRASAGVSGCKRSDDGAAASGNGEHGSAPLVSQAGVPPGSDIWQRQAQRRLASAKPARWLMTAIIK